MPDWKDFEGQLLDGKYPLEKHLSGDEASALFLIGFTSAAVRIRRAAPAEAAALVERWNRVKLLKHPHLLEIDAAGTSAIGGESVAYVVLEHGEENLAEILRDRALTPAEARELLLQVASTLEDLHSQGMAHGDLKAANIFATGNTVKLSSESVGDGDAAADIRALGFTLIHALTQRAEPRVEDAAGLPAPFDEIARGCLASDPSLRWPAKQVIARLRSPERARRSVPAPPAQGRRRILTPGFRLAAGTAGLVVAGFAIVAGIMMRRADHPTRPAVEPRATSSAMSPPLTAAPPTAPAPEASPVVPPPRPRPNTESTRDRLVTEDGVAHRVVPNVPEKARRTITGKPAVVVRVTADAAGDVTEAEVERTFSPYFSKLALEAARQWKFDPEQGASARKWNLRFVFTQRDTQVTALRVRQ